jgi:hypothetical protein
MSTVIARKRFESLFAPVRQPSREEMFMRPEFRVLAALNGLSFGECWDKLEIRARRKHDGNIEEAAVDWYALSAAPRL